CNFMTILSHRPQPWLLWPSAGSSYACRSWQYRDGRRREPPETHPQKDHLEPRWAQPRAACYSCRCCAALETTCYWDAVPWADAHVYYLAPLRGSRHPPRAAEHS